METLGLSSGTPEKGDNIVQRLFWPTIRNQYDVDLVGYQGFWVCIGIGVLTAVISIATGHFFAGVLIAVLYLAAGCGVRQRSVLAASLMFAFYLVSFTASSVLGAGVNPVVGLACVMLLAANVRASLLSRRWIIVATEDAGDLPERATGTVMERLANQLPEALWPKVKYVFYPTAAVMITLTIAGALFVSKQKKQPGSATSAHPAAAFSVPPAQ